MASTPGQAGSALVVAAPLLLLLGRSPAARRILSAAALTYVAGALGQLH